MFSLVWLLHITAAVQPAIPVICMVITITFVSRKRSSYEFIFLNNRVAVVSYKIVHHISRSSVWERVQSMNGLLHDGQ